MLLKPSHISIPATLLFMLHSAAGAEICAGVTCNSQYPAYAEAVRHPNATGNFTFDGLSIGSTGARRRAARDIDRNDRDGHDDDRDDNDRDDHDDHNGRGDGRGEDDDWTWHTRIVDVNVEADKNVLHQSFELYGRLFADRDDDYDPPRNVCALLLPLRDWDREQKGRDEDGDCDTVFQEGEIRDMKQQLRSAVERGYASSGQTSPCAEVTSLEFDVAGDIITTQNTTSNTTSLLAKYLVTEADSHPRNDTKPFATRLNQIRPILLLSYPASTPPENRRNDDDLIEMKLTCVWAKNVADGSQSPKPDHDDDDRDDDRDESDRDDRDRNNPDDRDREGNRPDGQGRGEDRDGNGAIRLDSRINLTIRLLLTGWGAAWLFF